MERPDVGHHGGRFERYSLTLPCGCRVDVTRNGASALPSTRVIDRRAMYCSIRNHRAGARVYVWELLPPRSHRETPDLS